MLGWLFNDAKGHCTALQVLPLVVLLEAWQTTHIYVRSAWQDSLPTAEQPIDPHLFNRVTQKYNLLQSVTWQAGLVANHAANSTSCCAHLKQKPSTHGQGCRSSSWEDKANQQRTIAPDNDTANE